MPIGSILTRCYAFDKMLASREQALGSVPREPATSGWVVLRDPWGTGPNLSLNRFPRGARAREAGCTRPLYRQQEREVERRIGAGATRYPWRYKPGGDLVVLEDPDGKLFCAVQKDGG